MNSLSVILVEVRGRQYGSEMQLSLVSITSRATANVQAEMGFLGWNLNYTTYTRLAVNTGSACVRLHTYANEH